MGPGRLCSRRSGLTCWAKNLQAGPQESSPRRALLVSGLSTAGLLSISTICGNASAADFAEMQAEKEARKQAILEAARAKATGEPLPEPPSEPVLVNAPDASSLDTSKLSYPAETPVEEKKAAAKSKSTRSPAKKTATKASSKKKEEGGSFATLDKTSLAKQRASRKAELLEKARAKALQEGSVQ